MIKQVIPTTEQATEHYALAKEYLDKAVAKMEAEGLETFKRNYSVNGGSAVVCVSCTRELSRAIILTSGVNGIICHPRSGAIAQLPYSVVISDEYGSYTETRTAPGVAGGWNDGKAELSTQYLFPLVDEDEASFVRDDTGAGEFTGYYGNLYWTDGNADDPVILSWRGTPTRHFQVPSDTNIPGLSIQETSAPGTIEDTPQYTTFGTALYKDGSVYLDAPQYNWPRLTAQNRCLILGACMDSEGTTYIAAQSDRYNAPSGVAGPGFYLTLWKEGGDVDGWQLVSETVYGRNGLPWFANNSGTEFVCSNGDRLTIDGTLTRKVADVGTQTETTGSIKFNYTFNGSDYYEFNGADVVKSDIAMTFTAETSRSNAGQVVQAYPPPYDMLLENPVQPLVLVRHLVGGSMAAYGGEMPYTFSPDVMCSCGSTFVTVTDACGNTDSGLIRGGTSANSEWVISAYNDSNPECLCSNVGRWEYTTVGGVKIYQWCTNEEVYACTGAEFIPQDTSVENALVESAATYTKVGYCQIVSKGSSGCNMGCIRVETTTYSWVCKPGYSC